MGLYIPLMGWLSTYNGHMLLPTWEHNVEYIQYYPILHLGLVKNEGFTIKFGIETAILGILQWDTQPTSGQVIFMA